MGFAMGFSGVWVWVQTFVPPENPYPSHGYMGFDPDLIGVQTPLETTSRAVFATCLSSTYLANNIAPSKTSADARFRWWIVVYHHQ